MSTIFQQLEDFANNLKIKLNKYKEVDENHDFSWPNFVYTDKKFRRAHLDVVDVRSTKKLYMMHLCVFPHTNDPSPIYGLDIIAGPNKVTGAFHDFSPVEDSHDLLDWFSLKTSQYTWKKTRELPDWAKNIFSENMVAASNIHCTEELEKFLELANETFDFYMENIGQSSKNDYTNRHNWYCSNQRKNPHTPRVMSALGLDSEEVSRFIQTCLFPDVSHNWVDFLAAYGASK